MSSRGKKEGPTLKKKKRGGEKDALSRLWRRCRGRELTRVSKAIQPAKRDKRKKKRRGRTIGCSQLLGRAGETVAERIEKRREILPMEKGGEKNLRLKSAVNFISRRGGKKGKRDALNSEKLEKIRVHRCYLGRSPKGRGKAPVTTGRIRTEKKKKGRGKVLAGKKRGRKQGSLSHR